MFHWVMMMKKIKNRKLSRLTCCPSSSVSPPINQKLVTHSLASLCTKTSTTCAPNTRTRVKCLRVRNSISTLAGQCSRTSQMSKKSKTTRLLPTSGCSTSSSAQSIRIAPTRSNSAAIRLTLMESLHLVPIQSKPSKVNLTIITSKKSSWFSATTCFSLA